MSSTTVISLHTYSSEEDVSLPGSSLELGVVSDWDVSHSNRL